MTVTLVVSGGGVQFGTFSIHHCRFDPNLAKLLAKKQKQSAIGSGFKVTLSSVRASVKLAHSLFGGLHPPKNHQPFFA